jgi:hypothetical protein
MENSSAYSKKYIPDFPSNVLFISTLLHLPVSEDYFKAGSTLAANSFGIQRFLTPTKKAHLAASRVLPLAAKTRHVFFRVLPQAYQTDITQRSPHLAASISNQYYAAIAASCRKG